MRVLMQSCTPLLSGDNIQAIALAVVAAFGAYFAGRGHSPPQRSRRRDDRPTGDP